MDHNAQEPIDTYSSENFSSELQKDLSDTLALCDAFEYSAIYREFPDVIYDVEAEDKEKTRLKVLSLFVEATDALFSAHQIEVVDFATLGERNQLLSVLHLLQSIEDPTPVLRILESSFSEEEQFAKIVESYSTLDEAIVLSLVESIDPSTLKILQSVLYQKEELLDEVNSLSDEIKAKLVGNLKDFFHVHGEENIAFEMIQNGITIGFPLKLYYPYVGEHLVSESDEHTAKNLLAFFFMSYDTFNDPLKVYYEHSENLLSGKGHGRIQKVEQILMKLLSDLRSYQKAKDDAVRLG